MNFRTLDLNLLRVLDVLLQEHSTVRAGARIGLSQPAVSAALGRLRHALGDDLFIRRGQRLEPTDFARDLAAPLRELLNGLEGLLMVPEAFDPSRAEDTFTISGADVFSEILIPELASLLSKQAPLMRLELVDLVQENDVEMLERHRVDLALLRAVGLPEWVDHRPLFRSRSVVAARRGHPRLSGAGLVSGDTIPIDLFCDIGQVLQSPGGTRRAMGDVALARVGRQRRVAMTVPTFAAVVRAVGNSDLIALLPSQVAEREASALGLEIYEPPMAVEVAQLVMVWHKRATGNPAHFWLREKVATIISCLDTGL